MEYGSVYIVLAGMFGFFMAWGVGANDVANAMGTSVGSKALTIKQAIVVAIIFEAAGAMLAGGQVTSTISRDLIDLNALSGNPDSVIYGMLAALLAAGSWLLIASHYGWPVSTTHSIIGAMVGFGSVCLGVDKVEWHFVINIFLSWILTPIIAGVIAYILFKSVQKNIFNTDNPVENAITHVPKYIFMVSMVTLLVTMVQGIKMLGLDIKMVYDILIASGLSVMFSLIGYWHLRKMKLEVIDDSQQRFNRVEKIFAVLMVFTACAMAFAHGSNDVANAIGPLAAVVTIVENNGLLTAQTHIPLWVMVLGAVGIVLGLSMYGHRVMATIGTNITQLTPSRGFAAQLATASTVIFSSGLGLPVSTTQTLVGAILGVGFARGMGALNTSVIRNILMSWIITVPAGAVLAIAYYYIVMELFV